jgi:hypothetical protein
MPPMSFHDAESGYGQMSHMQSPQLSTTDLDWLQQALSQEHHAQGSSSGSGSSNSNSLVASEC